MSYLGYPDFFEPFIKKVEETRPARVEKRKKGEEFPFMSLEERQEVLKYRNRNASLPSESHLVRIKEQFVRLGTLHYRAQWIGFDSEPNAILAYTQKHYHSIALRPGYVVLYLDGRVDNAPAVQAFAEELDKRKSEVKAASGPLKVLDYWFTWILAMGLILGLFQIWRRKADS